MAAKNYVIRVIKDLKFLCEMNGDQQKQWLGFQNDYGKEVLRLTEDNLKLTEDAAQLQNALNDFAAQNMKLREQLSTHVTVMAENATLYKRIAELDLKLESESKKHLPKNDTFTAKFSGGAEINLTIPQKEN